MQNSELVSVKNIPNTNSYVLLVKKTISGDLLKALNTEVFKALEIAKGPSKIIGIPLITPVRLDESIISVNPTSPEIITYLKHPNLQKLLFLSGQNIFLTSIANNLGKLFEGGKIQAYHDLASLKEDLTAEENAYIDNVFETNPLVSED